MNFRLGVPSIGSREVSRSQRTGFWNRKSALQPLDFGNGLLGIHSVSISNISTTTVKRDGINDVIAPHAVDEPPRSGARRSIEYEHNKFRISRPTPLSSCPLSRRTRRGRRGRGRRKEKRR